MISMQQFGRILLMGCAVTATSLVAAQSEDPTITLSDGEAECAATLTSLVIDPADGSVSADVVSLENCAGASTASPQITSFTVNGGTSTTVDAGTAVNVEWTSTDASGCTASGTLPSWEQQGSTLAASGEFSASTTGLAIDDYTLGLSCSSDQETVSIDFPRVVTVQDDSTSVDGCSTRPPPPNVTRATTVAINGTNDATQFSSVFGGPFPSGDGNSHQVSLPDGFYAAMEFKTGPVPKSAKGWIASVLVNNPPANTVSDSRAPRLWSISTCPGDFRKAVLDDQQGPGCVQGGDDQAHFGFGGRDLVDDSGWCALQSNTTYYLNLLYTEQDPPATEAGHDALEGQCGDDNCANEMATSAAGF